MPLSNSNIPTALKIIELVEIICQYLDLDDILRCVLLCKTVYSAFQTSFWRNVCIGKTLPHNLATFHQGLNLIRNITVYGDKRDVVAGILAHGLSTYSPISEPAAGPPYQKSVVGASALIPTTANTILDSTSSLCCTNLRKLTITSNSHESRPDGTLRGLVPLLQHNSNLMHLDIATNILIQKDRAACHEFIKAVKNLRQLRHFAIRGGSLPLDSTTLSLMQATVSLPNVRELHWDFFIQPDVDADRHHYPLSLEQLGQLAYMIVRQALAFRKAEGHTWHKIASLTIPSTRREHRISILVPLLHSELFELQALQIPSTDRYLHDEALESAIRMYCPKVKLLTCPPFTVENNELDNACAVVRACSKLQRFRAGDWGESGSSHGRLSTLVEHHAETLEEIEIVSSTYVSSRDQQAILASCKRLTRFWIVVDSVVGGLQFDDILSKEWVCIEMRELFLKLDRYDFQEEDRPPVCVDIVRQDSYNTPDEHCQGQKDLDDLSPQLLVRRRSSTTDQRSARRVYKQIGRLVGLQFVALAVHTQERPAHATARFAWDLTMRTGHLPELKGLKRLTHLHMADDLWTNMGQDEVEFMEAEWPVLVEVSFEMRTREDEFQALVKESHWRWLQGRRPTLHYLNLTMKTRKHHQHI